MQVSHVAGRGLHNWTIFGCLPRHIGREPEWKESVQDLVWHPRGCPWLRRGLNLLHCHTALFLSLCLLDTPPSPLIVAIMEGRRIVPRAP